MATSAAAAGKIALAVARNQKVPDGWVIGSDGRPTNDPRQLRQGGALLPLGGPEGGYKGTGLAVMVEILCGLLTGLGFGVEPTGRHNDGCFMAVFNVAAFRPLAEFKKDVGEFAAYLKSTPPAEGSSGVLYPGEIEHIGANRTAARTASRSRTRPGSNCKPWPRATASPTSSNSPIRNKARTRWPSEPRNRSGDARRQASAYPADELFFSQYPGSAGKTGWQRVAWGAPSSVSAAARQTA